MKITGRPRRTSRPRTALRSSSSRVFTDEGVTGVGEATLAQANQLLFHGVNAIRPLVVGLDPANIEEIWQRIFRRFLRIGPRGVVTCLLSAVDIALWDLKGKVLGVPV